MEKRVRISFEQFKFTKWCKELDTYAKQLQNVLDKYVEKGIIKQSDIIPELVKALLRQDYSLLREIVRERGLHGAKGASYAMERVVSREVKEMEKQVRIDLQFLDTAQMLQDWKEESEFITVEDGVIKVDDEALREHLPTYMIIDDETQAVIDRARKLWEELKQLDKDLASMSVQKGSTVRLFGNGYETNSLISVTDCNFVMFDEKVLSGINGNVKNHPEEKIQEGWIARKLED